MTLNQYWIWFSSINILPIKKMKLLQKYLDLEKIFFLSENELLTIYGMDFMDIYEIKNSKNIDLIKKYENYINKNEIQVINITDKLYPLSLKNIYDPPVLIFAKGNIDLLNSVNNLAIVGSREASEYGLKQSYRFANELALNDILIISRIG